MSRSKGGQVSGSAAEVYEQFFIPALFEQWAEPVVRLAGVRAGERCLDVACGTGVLTRAVARQVGAEGAVIGLDLNEDMLAVARRRAPQIDWRQGAAEALPFAAEHYDRVVSQFGLMFFEDKVAALREMFRVLRPGGRMAVAVWDTLDNTPGYAAVTALLSGLFGDEVADALRFPYSLGDKRGLLALFEAAGLPEATITTQAGQARFESIGAWMHTDVKGWTLADVIDDAQYDLLLREAEAKLGRFVSSDGVVFAAPAHIVTVDKG